MPGSHGKQTSASGRRPSVTTPRSNREMHRWQPAGSRYIKTGQLIPRTGGAPRADDASPCFHGLVSGMQTSVRAQVDSDHGYRPVCGDRSDRPRTRAAAACGRPLVLDLPRRSTRVVALLHALDGLGQPRPPGRSGPVSFRRRPRRIRRRRLRSPPALRPKARESAAFPTLACDRQPACPCLTGAAEGSGKPILGGHGVVPNEQNTQQSPGAGRAARRRPCCRRELASVDRICSRAWCPQNGQVRVDSSWTAGILRT